MVYSSLHTSPGQHVTLLPGTTEYVAGPGRSQTSLGKARLGKTVRTGILTVVVAFCDHSGHKISGSSIADLLSLFVRICSYVHVHCDD